MPKCKECERNCGLLELKGGVCRSCINKATPECGDCGQRFDSIELEDGICKKCAQIRAVARAQTLEQERTVKEIESIILTTETAPNFEIHERIEIVTAECAFGMNILSDLFASVRDIVGGRSGVTQNILKDSRKIVLSELKREAHDAGANAVVGVSLSYSEFSGGGKSMIFVVACGTAVKAQI
jgi:uncharacterized protein YbjQ (UPF0145 family)